METNHKLLGDQKMTLGEKLREARKQHGLSQEELAQKLCVSRQAVTKWESGKGLPDVENLKLISALLSVSVDYLLDDSEIVQPIVIKEAIDLSSYTVSGKCKCKEDAAVVGKYPSADHIWYLIRSKKLNKKESIADFLTLGTLKIVDALNDTSINYLIEKDHQQILVNVSKDFFTSTVLAKRIDGRKFTIGQNEFLKVDYDDILPNP